jgi:hypothetical protein
MSRLEHRIRSLCWQVETGSSAEAFAWRSLLHARGTDLLLPVLEQGFDAAVPADEVVRIPRLSLHLRLNSPDELETVLLEAIPRQLREQLAGLRGQRSFSEEKRAEDERVQAVGGWHHLQSLLHYLQTGTLPWAAAVGSATDQLIALRAAQARLWPQLIDHLRRRQEAASFFFRLLHLIPEEDIGSAIGDLAGLFPGEESVAVLKCLVSLRKAETGLSRYARLSLMAALLAAMIDRDSRSTAISLSKVAASALLPGEWQQLERVIAALPPRAASLLARIGPEEEANNEEQPWRGGEEPDHDPFVAAAQEEGEPSGTNPDQSAAREQRRGQLLEANESARHGDGAEPGSGQEPAEKLFPLQIAQAGLVLLHPYLNRFFEHCGVKEPEQKKLPPYGLPRMAALLHYLATGREQVAEFELGMIKVLLGLEPRSSLPICEGLLTEADKVESQSLLHAVISHWSALKATSVPGLRSSFIERPGLLRQIEGGWRLNVERRSYDLLLERIPWSFSLVRLPWMDRPLFVEW